jgi:hypothetical protein
LRIPPFSLVKSKKIKDRHFLSWKGHLFTMQYAPAPRDVAYGDRDRWAIRLKAGWFMIGFVVLWVLTREHMYIRCFKNKWWICPMFLLWWSNLDL